MGILCYDIVQEKYKNELVASSKVSSSVHTIIQYYYYIHTPLYSQWNHILLFV